MKFERKFLCILLLAFLLPYTTGYSLSKDAAPGAPSAPPSVSEIKVFYATNRKILDNAKAAAKGPDYEYGNWFGSDLSYGTAQIQVPSRQPDWFHHFSSKRNYLSAVRAEDKFWNKSKQITLNPAQGNDFPDGLKSAKKILVFVHGYNTSLDKALKTAARIAFDFQAMSPDGEPVTPVVFSWPSTEKIMSYIADEERVSLSGSHFHKFMDKVFDIAAGQKSGVGKASSGPALYLVSHSMGNRLMLNYLADRGSKIDAKAPAVQRIVRKWLMCSPDVSTLQYVAESADAEKVVSPIRILFSDSDRALLMSEELHESPRLGRPAVSTALLKVLSFLPPSMARMLYFKVDLLPDWLPDLVADKVPGAVKDNGLVQTTVNAAETGVSKVTQLPSLAISKVHHEPQPMQDPNTVFIDFTQLDIGAFRIALTPITFQLGHSLPGPVIASLLQDNESGAAPPQWTEVQKNRIFQLATNKTEPLAKRTIKVKKVVFDRSQKEQTKQASR